MLMRGTTKEQLIARLLARRSIESGCWNWTGKTRDGYGAISVSCKTIGVHRLAAHVFSGFDLNSKASICHTCDNRKCFNPEHLFIGNHTMNMADASRKGRMSTPKRKKGVNC